MHLHRCITHSIFLMRLHESVSLLLLLFLASCSAAGTATPPAVTLPAPAAVVLPTATNGPPVATATLVIQQGRIYKWMSKGALPTESVAQLFKTAGVDARFERFKKGEAVDALLAEAAKAKEGRVVSPKTSK